jgi:hypothetical protein
MRRFSAAAAVALLLAACAPAPRETEACAAPATGVSSPPCISAATSAANLA